MPPICGEIREGSIDCYSRSKDAVEVKQLRLNSRDLGMGIWIDGK